MPVLKRRPYTYHAYPGWEEVPVVSISQRYLEGLLFHLLCRIEISV